MSHASILRQYERMQHPGQVKLIEIGWHPAKPAGEIALGDVIVYNYGSEARVVKVEGVRGKLVTFWTEAMRERDFYGTKACYRSRCRIDSLVGFDAKASQKESV